VPSGDKRPEIKREVKELSLLLELSETLGHSVDLRDTVLPLLQTMERHMGMLRGTLSLVDHSTGQVIIEVAHGLTDAQKERGRYRSGEGVTGRVVQTGRVAVVPRIAADPLFLDRTGARKGLRKEDIGTSAAMHEVYDLIFQVAKSNTTVLIRGESGTGKELVANSIHYTSPRAGDYRTHHGPSRQEIQNQAAPFGHRKVGSWHNAHQDVAFGVNIHARIHDPCQSIASTSSTRERQSLR